MTKEQRTFYRTKCNSYEAQAKKYYETRVMPNNLYRNDDSSDITKLISAYKKFKYYPIMMCDGFKSERHTLDLYDHYSNTGKHIVHYKSPGWLTIIRKDTCQSFTFRWRNAWTISYGNKVVCMGHKIENLIRIVEEQLDIVKIE